MFKISPTSVAALSIVMAGGLWSCAKEELAKPGQAEPAKTDTPKPYDEKVGLISGLDDFWNKFVDSVSTGKEKDPLGQYVSKDTYVQNPGEGTERPTRPKYTQEERETKLKLLTGQTKQKSTGVGTANGKSYSYQFSSSEGLGLVSNPTPYYDQYNPDNYVYDLKIVKDGKNPLPGYTLIPLDLNRGAGGQYIYLSFTRDVRYYTNAGTSYEGDNYQAPGPVRDVTSVSGRFGASFSSWPNYFTPAWTEWNCDFAQCWKEGDLNDGAGGRYIYAYQSKLGFRGSPVEVGVLSGNGDISPPAGWQRVGVDLNEGAGGAYVWFCIKRR
jgi:hypothetical protein